METTTYGELVPKGGGDPIPMLRKNLKVGRRESCDIVLRFANVSAHHCQLTVSAGYWHVRDLGSRNGTKVNGVGITEGERLLKPGDELTVAKHTYVLKYAPADLGAKGPPPPAEPVSGLFKQSLMERAGLNNAKAAARVEAASVRRIEIAEGEEVLKKGRVRDKARDDE